MHEPYISVLPQEQPQWMEALRREVLETGGTLATPSVSVRPIMRSANHNAL